MVTRSSLFAALPKGFCSAVKQHIIYGAKICYFNRAGGKLSINSYGFPSSEHIFEALVGFIRVAGITDLWVQV